MVAHAADTATFDMDAGSVLEAIRNGDYSVEIERIHDEADKDKREGLKKLLPGVTWSGKFSQRASEKLIQHSGLLCADLDKLNGDLPEVDNKLKQSQHLLASFVSPSGSGLKALFRVPADVTQHAGSFRAVEDEVLRLTGRHIDQSCKDVARLCFVSYDPELYFNPNATELAPVPQPEKRKIPNNGAINLSERQGIAVDILGEIDWQSETRGFLDCPGKHLHTTGNAERDCEIHLDGAPTLHCFHNSCRGIVNAVNHELRSRVGKAEYIKPQHVPELPSLLSICETGFKDNITFVSDHVPVVLATWVAHTHCVQYFNRTPYLSISSPTKRCGKSNLLSCLAKVCARSWYSIPPSVAVLFRKIERDMPTLLLDEADRCFADGEDSDHDMLAILNSGYKRGGTVDRCGGPNKTDLESFNVFCPKAFAGIGRLPDTTEDRCLPIRMERQPKHSKRFLEEVVAAELTPIRDGFEKWAARSELKDELDFDIPEKDFPDSIGDRAVEVCEPLFKIAKLASGDWYKRIREATAAICGSEEDQDKSVLGLAAIREAFRSDEFVISTELIDRIREQDDPPFPDWWFKKDVEHAAMGRSLSRMLKPFKVKPERHYVDGERVRGYKRDRLEPIWNAYL